MNYRTHIRKVALAAITFGVLSASAHAFTHPYPSDPSDFGGANHAVSTTLASSGLQLQAIESVDSWWLQPSHGHGSDDKTNLT